MEQIEKILKNRHKLDYSTAKEHKTEIIKHYKEGRALKQGDGFNIRLPCVKNDKTFKFGDLRENEIGVEVVANMAMFMDSDNDVLLKNCWNDSIKLRGNTIKFQHDHKTQVINTIGDTIKLENRLIDLKPYGYDKIGNALVHIAKVVKEYNSAVFEQYKRKQIQQHSIGMFYEELEFIDLEGDEEGKKLYESIKSDIINLEDVQKNGYFWAVSKIDIFENSAVLFGVNKLTPTLEIQTGNKSFNFFSNIVQA